MTNLRRVLGGANLFFLYFVCYFTLASFLLICCFILYDRSLRSLMLFALWWMAALVPQTHFPTWKRSWFWSSMAEYLDMQIIYDGVSEDYVKQNGRHYLTLAFPHGILPIGGIALSTVERHLIGHWIVGSGLMIFPFVKNVAGIFGVSGASRNEIVSRLKEGNAQIYPGGLRETFLSSFNEEAIIFKKRYGLVKCAIEAKADLIPLYIFGQSRLMKFSIPFWLKWFASRIRFAIGWARGRWGTWIPYPQKHVAVFGKPIRIPENASVDDMELVQKLRQEAEDSIKTIFEKYKHICPEYDKASLVIY